MENIIARDIESIEISGIRKFFNALQNYPDALSFVFGEPDFPVPEKIKTAVSEALDLGKTGYTSNAGIPELREEICKYLLEKNIKYSPDETALTVGCAEGLLCAFKAVINSGDKVLIPNPGFPSYKSLLKLCGADPIYYEFNDDFSINIEDLEYKLKIHKPKAIVLCFPSNPTGAILSKNDRESLYEIIKNNNIIAISDEIYCELCFDEYYTPIQHEDIKDKFILVSGFSKMFSMTGLRVGYVCASEQIIKAVLKVHSYNCSCAPSICQWGALTGMKECRQDAIDMKNEFIRRRNYVYDRLVKMGLDVEMPKGAFYIFPSIKKFGIKSNEFCLRLLDEAGVAVVPGDAFGDKGEGYMRISYSDNLDNLKKGLDRIEKFIKINFELVNASINAEK
ncbi:putative N-acetyl-LL-diaminopimelate aminotransferase [Clostridium pasteurianum DSM 525 = ATCC 6013]|uniref:Aminotransferase n=1 Tax=Clostridium pasteurianum DSM 525 = ATCC 6013 TaxID=1262449 RepID=A0A0H3JB71_CLOPA|nr:aminotransferase class I/II-fold pyridoxal phosphate-dependent enzyme [Clostridium pasteurianum]AJA49220.1 putative N-acetyl-LL-diaminopimelate aminotransferase [Clostridium pasteurianum DSM 525 = ATCC 6013]AJA53208.1 putative N-acetyl-LL-diaminopimelate aminotransferase [Clostridium pasteurianum DSM 525 = ATCC 6013]AOZ76402.1 aspartate aminotransferase [Clostridium pasteurianum DSM 525 = ATCC 6013]AOZ80199.1 aspartate aminotransferase [Clostridium pasteurianum]ELP59153.1 class I/II aminotr